MMESPHADNTDTNAPLDIGPIKGLSGARASTSTSDENPNNRCDAEPMKKPTCTKDSIPAGSETPDMFLDDGSIDGSMTLISGTRPSITANEDNSKIILVNDVYHQKLCTDANNAISHDDDEVRYLLNKVPDNNWLTKKSTAAVNTVLADTTNGKTCISDAENFTLTGDENLTTIFHDVDGVHISCDDEMLDIKPAGVTEEITTFEEVMDLVGTRGRWNVLIILLCSFNGMLLAFSSLTYQFLGSTPDYWCHVEALSRANWTQQQIITLATPTSDSGSSEGCVMYNYNYTAAVLLGFNRTMSDVSAVTNPGERLITCHTRDYNLSQYSSSIVTEWDLTCGRQVLLSTTQAAVQIGMLIGCWISSYTLDRFGRRKVVLVSSLVALVISFIITLAPNVETFIVLRVLFNSCGACFYSGCFLIAMEVCSPSQRNYVGPLYLLPWALGYMLMPGVAYLVRPWRWMQAAFSLPLFYSLAYFWFLPESPRWLILQGRHTEALTILKEAAAMNRRTLPSDDVILTAIDNIRQQETSSKSETDLTRPSRENMVLSLLKYVFLLVRTPGVRGRVVIIFYLWITMNTVYYGVSLNSYNLKTDIYIYTFLSGLLEVPAYLILWVAVKTMGRRRTLALLFLWCGISISVLAALMWFLQKVPEGVKMFLSLSGKMAITAVMQLTWFYTPELFSTHYRARVLTEASMFSRIGAASSPYINDMLGQVVVWGPSAMFSMTALVAAVLVFYLPETTNKNMPQRHR